MHQAFYFSLFLRMLARGANDLASEKPLLAFCSEFSYFSDMIALWAMFG